MYSLTLYLTDCKDSNPKRKEDLSLYASLGIRTNDYRITLPYYTTRDHLLLHTNETQAGQTNHLSKRQVDQGSGCHS